MAPARYTRLLVLAALVGVPAAVIALLFTSAAHGLEHLLWHDLADALGEDQPPWWLVLALPALGGALVALAIERLPGHGGHPPLDGVALDAPTPLQVPSIALAALASLSFGAVVGPEAPLLALGLAVGALAARAVGGAEQETKLLALAGAFAAVSTVFGGPFPAALLLFEVAALSGAAPAQMLGRMLLPGFLAAGTAALIFTGVNDWPGVHEISLRIPNLPEYPTVRAADVAWTIPVALAAGIAATAALAAARRLAAAISDRPPLTVLATAGLAIGAAALAFRAIAGRPAELVLFSGQAAVTPVVAEMAAGVLALLILLKAVAFAFSVAAGFRGGLVFPAVLIGVAIAALAADLLPGLDLTPAVIAGVAAAAAAALRAPFFGAVMAALLAGAAIADTAPIAIIAATCGWLAASATEPAGTGATT